MHTIGCTELSDPAGHADSGTRPGGGGGFVFAAGGGRDCGREREVGGQTHLLLTFQDDAAAAFLAVV